ncbi:MAG: GIY-YIG nuclease family protein [Planctomycetota bacterium]|nr:GIY-YIG nuclease family protein [Planctomycetota bacterium]
MAKNAKTWLVYILKCADGTYYCGCTNDLEKRVQLHNDGKGARYTRGRGPVVVLATRLGLTHSEACKLERLVKRKAKHLKLKALNEITLS